VYLPSRFVENDPERLRAFISRYDFATLITHHAGSTLVSHAPLLLLADRGPRGILLGHLARANPMSAHLDASPAVTAVFMGPHAYISPSWYVDEETVPTWNYAAVYVEGHARPIHDEGAVAEVLARTVAVHESAGAWRFDPQGPLAGRLIPRVRAFEIEIERIAGKFKLEQGASAADRDRLAARLEADGDTGHAELARLMRSARPGGGSG
jgi:transcriptional regulator